MRMISNNLNRYGLRKQKPTAVIDINKISEIA
jgi:hypothetical protein